MGFHALQVDAEQSLFLSLRFLWGPAGAQDVHHSKTQTLTSYSPYIFLQHFPLPNYHDPEITLNAS